MAGLLERLLGTKSGSELREELDKMETAEADAQRTELVTKRAKALAALEGPAKVSAKIQAERKKWIEKVRAENEAELAKFAARLNPAQDELTRLERDVRLAELELAKIKPPSLVAFRDEVEKAIQGIQSSDPTSYKFGFARGSGDEVATHSNRPAINASLTKLGDVRKACDEGLVDIPTQAGIDAWIEARRKELGDVLSSSPTFEFTLLPGFTQDRDGTVRRE